MANIPYNVVENPFQRLLGLSSTVICGTVPLTSGERGHIPGCAVCRQALRTKLDGILENREASIFSDFGLLSNLLDFRYGAHTPENVPTESPSFFPEREKKVPQEIG